MIRRRTAPDATAETGTDPSVYRPQEIKPFLEHLEDLRRAILQVLAFTAVGMVACFPLAPRMLALAMRPLSGAAAAGIIASPDAFLKSPEVVGAFTVAMRLALGGGLILSLPFSLAAVARFVAPGLTLRERRCLGRGMLIGAGLFLAGVVFCYLAVLPRALVLLLRIHRWIGVEPWWFVTSYVTFVMRLLVAMGLAFELPVILLVLVQIGLLSREQMAAKRRHAVVAIFVIAMMLTPPDPWSQIMMAIPMIVLYEICIVLAGVVERRRSVREAGPARPPGGPPAARTD